jgi:simple sugar transport system ATP-binding protein
VELTLAPSNSSTSACAAARAANKAILLVSAELNEVLALADRVAVMYRGKFAVVMPVAEASEESLGEYMIGTRKDSAA